MNGLHPEHIAYSYAAIWKMNPDKVCLTAKLYRIYNKILKGYADSSATVCRALLAGQSFRTTGTIKNPTGSHANGGAMRIAPIGLAFRHLTQPPPLQDTTDDNNHSPPPLLREVVAEAIAATHVHPEAIDGATVIAFFVGRCCLKPRPEDFQFLETIKEVRSLCETEEMKNRLQIIEEKWQERKKEREMEGGEGKQERKTKEEMDKEDREMAGLLSSQWFQLRAVDAVGVALWLFGRHGLPGGVEVVESECCSSISSRGEECLVRAVAIGGDTDTIACIVGAMLGALYGSSWIPVRWYDKMENGERGRDYVIALAERLALLDLKSIDSPLSDANDKVEAFKSSLFGK